MAPFLLNNITKPMQAMHPNPALKRDSATAWLRPLASR